MSAYNKRFSPKKAEPTSRTRRNSIGSANRPVDRESVDSQYQCEYYAFNPNDHKGKERGGDSGGTDMPMTMTRDELSENFQVGNFTIDPTLQNSLYSLVRKEGLTSSDRR